MLIFKSSELPEYHDPSPHNRIVKPLFDKKDIPDAKLSVNTLRLEQNAVVPEHIHDGGVEVIYVLEGILTFTVDGETAEAKPGDIVYVPENIKHSTTNKYPQAGKALCIFTPSNDYTAMRSWTEIK
ncbi:cupin domain-containing protein [Desulfovibrio litoralis]|uniref:Cupin domain protein n=1 Tax=Desulfovibrio litoralis DSM 11393 TaxID=1121455 RepID=A0A1M7S928_9BACT|nr:cupin domain-containing protein [Desulfovibrio litoralis]SHN54986.1 Cupin domain protein [Desulfovibrio litoralis DSM 11393]